MDAQEIKMDARESALDLFRRRRIELQEEQMGKIEEKYNKMVENMKKGKKYNEVQAMRLDAHYHTAPILIEEDDVNENRVWITKYQDGMVDEDDFKDSM